MLFVGLVSDPGSGWGLPDDPLNPRRARFTWAMVPWRLLAWAAIVVAMFAVSRTLGGLEGYGLMLLAVAVGSARLNRELGPSARGMRDYQA